ncbi:MAG: hypothetical protein GWO02_08105, partial [Gammaproteobacteria bacterium]|nr:hypothetical protein [Gammaproteobacteria bacterium]
QLDVGAVSLRETWLRKRPWAWLLFLAILGFGLGVPFATIHDTPLPWAPAAESAAPGGAAMDWHRLGGDRFWDSGPMSRAHR